jgi:tRNA(Ile)-lysidine synthase
LDNLIHRFGQHWKEKQYAAPGQKVLLAVSGGADSMVMAQLFHACSIPFAIAHCNFGLRAAEADADEQLVKDWGNERGVTVHAIRFATKEKSEEWKKGTQETARILRYEWFDDVRAAHNYARVVTGHHADDNVETLLINLFKGTGISGLHGILAENGYIVRPLLFAKKSELEAFAEANEVPFRKDASNDTDDYLRNAVRHNIVPAVTQWFPEAVAHVNESITRFAEAEHLYNRAVAHERKKLVEQRGRDYYIPVLKLMDKPALKTLCYELFKPFGFTPGQVPHILSLLDAETGHYIVSGTHRVIRNRNFLIVTTAPTEQADMLLVEGVPCTITTGKYTYSFSIQAKPESIPADRETACIDLKGIDFPIILRKWRMGDYFYPFGMGMKKKKIARLLIDEKLALHEKEEVRVVECNKRIAWVSGLRPDERFKIKSTTEKVLLIKRRLVS